MNHDDLPRISCWADVQKQKDAGGLTRAELRLIDAAKEGLLASLGDTVPKSPSDAVLIRAPLLRYLILGGCADFKTETAGVQVSGAWIAGKLDLNFAKASGAIRLFHCHIAEQPQMFQLDLPLLNLNGSLLPKGLQAQGMQVGDSVFLRGVIAKGEVSLSAAVITGQLDCTGATLENAKGDALNMQRTTVKEGFIWRDMKAVAGKVDLTSAHLSDLVDDAASWDKCDSLTLVGLTYDVLHGSLDVKERLSWLKKGAVWKGEFHPQPYEQLAKVLRNSGHRVEATEIRFAQPAVSCRQAHR